MSEFPEELQVIGGGFFFFLYLAQITLSLQILSRDSPGNDELKVSLINNVRVKYHLLNVGLQWLFFIQPLQFYSIHLLWHCACPLLMIFMCLSTSTLFLFTFFSISHHFCYFALCFCANGQIRSCRDLCSAENPRMNGHQEAKLRRGGRRRRIIERLERIGLWLIWGQMIEIRRGGGFQENGSEENEEPPWSAVWMNSDSLALSKIEF